MGMQGSLCGHTLEKCPNCKGNHVAFGSGWENKSDAAKPPQQVTMTRTA
jgi:hypothetical protein